MTNEHLHFHQKMETFKTQNLMAEICVNTTQLKYSGFKGSLTSWFSLYALIQNSLKRDIRSWSIFSLF